MEDRGRHRIGIGVQRDGRTPSGKCSPYGRPAGLELPRVSP
jgi:hypothetical protein